MRKLCPTVPHHNPNECLKKKSDFFFSAGESDEGGSSHWVKRSILVDSRTSVTDVQFAPKHLGLQLVKYQTIW